MKGIFIVSTPLYGYCNQVAEAFRSAGYSCDSFVYRIPDRLLSRLFPLNYFYKTYFFRKENKRISEQLSQNKNIGTILFFGMCEMSLTIVQELKMKLRLKVVFWFIDSIYRHKNFFKCLPVCDYAFTYNLAECNDLDQMGIKNNFLPLFYDPSFYYPIDFIDKQLDIFFVGALRSRTEFLNDLSCQLYALVPEIRMNFYGHLSPLFIFMNKRKYPWFFKYHVNQSLSHRDINLLYNKSEICLNLQPVQATSALNIRTFEIYGSGAIQFTDGNRDIISTLFTPGEDLIHFNNIIELLNLIIDYFTGRELHKYDRIQSNYSERSSDRHTINERVRFIIEKAFPSLSGNDNIRQ